MVLSGGLSNRSFEDLLQYLTPEKFSKAPRRAKPKAGWSDGRRKFGTVRGAVLTVLKRAGGEMRMRDVHAEVEQELDGTVSFQSVADCLIKGSKGAKPHFERTRHGHYRLLR